jgi:hypothetical protein
MLRSRHALKIWTDLWRFDIVAESYRNPNARSNGPKHKVFRSTVLRVFRLRAAVDGEGLSNGGSDPGL